MKDRFDYWKTIFGLLARIEHALALEVGDVRALPNSESAVGLRVSVRVCDVTAEALVLIADRGDGLFIYYTTGGDGVEVFTGYTECAEQIRGLVRRVVGGISSALSKWKSLFQDGVITGMQPRLEEDLEGVL